MKVTLKDKETLRLAMLEAQTFGDTDRELGYVAGIIDGEGCFVKSLDKRSGKFNCKIHVDMTDKDSIDRVNTLFPGKVYHITKKPFPHYKPSWRWCLFKQEDIFNCLLRIRPLLNGRRLQKSRELFDCLEPRVVK